MQLTAIPWLSDTQRAVLSEHHIVTLEALAEYELRDSMADVVSIDNLRKLAKRARKELGRDDPMRMIGAAAGQRGPVKYAGNVTYGENDG